MSIQTIITLIAIVIYTAYLAIWQVILPLRKHSSISPIPYILLSLGILFLILLLGYGEELVAADWAQILLMIGLVTITAVYAQSTQKMAKEMREQLKLNTFLALLSELAESKYRGHRELIHKNITSLKQATSIKESMLRGKPYDAINDMKNAIEETISSLDRIGFFLIKGDPRLKDDAPEWIWTITSQMWARTEWYVQHRKEDSRGYGKYFEELHNEAERRGFKERLKNNGSEVKEVA